MNESKEIGWKGIKGNKKRKDTVGQKRKRNIRERVERTAKCKETKIRYE